MSEQELVAGVDVGGTNVTVGLVDGAHAVVARAKAPTPMDGMALLPTIADLVRSLGAAPAAVGVGIPGTVVAGRVTNAPNLAASGVPMDIAGELGALLGVPVALGNDVDVGLLGEWTAGAAVGRGHVLGVWLGTGIGGSLVVDGRPYGGADGAAGEIGHMSVDVQGRLCPCGRRGCVEAYAGRRAMTTRVHELVDQGRDSTLPAIQRTLGKATATARVWQQALAEGDRVATEVFEEGLARLAVGIGGAVSLLGVDTVVVGGGMVEKLGPPLVARLEVLTRPHVVAVPVSWAFLASSLGDFAGVVGAAVLARAVGG